MAVSMEMGDWATMLPDILDIPIQEYYLAVATIYQVAQHQGQSLNILSTVGVSGNQCPD